MKQGWTQPKIVIRRGGYDEKYLQPDNSWGDYKTSRRFSNQETADKHAKAHAQGDDYGLFPVSVKRYRGAA